MINKVISIIKGTTLEIIKKSVPNFDPNFFSTRRQLNSPTGTFNLDNPYTQSVWIYAANKKISASVSQSPYVFYKEENGQKEILDKDDPLNVLFDKPNPLMSRQEIMEATMIYMGLDGEAFWILERKEETDLPEHVWCFRKNFFRPEVNKKTGLIDYWHFEGIPKKIIPENIIHFKYFNPNSNVRGLAPWLAASLATEQDYFASNYNTNFFKEGAAIGGFLEIEEQLDDEQYDRLLAATEDRHKGHTKAHRLMLLEGGAKFKEAKLSQRDMEFIETKKISKSEILAAYGTNPVVLGDFSDVKSEAGVRSIFKNFWSSVVIPNQDYIENKMYSDFLMGYDPEIHVFFDNSNVEILQEDLGILLERAEKLFNLGYSANDINKRLDLGMPEIDNGNNSYLPGNYLPVEVLNSISTQGTIEKTLNIKKKDIEQDRLLQHEKEQVKSEKEFTKIVRGYFNEQEKRVIIALEKIPEITLIANYKNHSSKAIEDDLFDEEEKEIERLVLLLSPIWEESYIVGFETVAINLNLDVTFNPLSPDFLKFQEFKLTKIAPSIFETVKNGVRQALKDGLAERETTQEIAARIKRVYEMADTRAITIGRTESTSSLNAGRVNMYKHPDSKVNKIKWLTARDENVRSSHILLDGQKAIPGQFFVRKNGIKSKLRFPGDMNAPAKEVISCRCVVIEDFEELED